MFSHKWLSCIKVGYQSCIEKGEGEDFSPPTHTHAHLTILAHLWIPLHHGWPPLVHWYLIHPSSPTSRISQMQDWTLVTSTWWHSTLPLFHPSPISGCHCKRSGCLKNYCECYEAKIPCSVLCKCVECKNRPGSEMKSLLQLADVAGLCSVELHVWWNYHRLCSSLFCRELSLPAETRCAAARRLGTEYSQASHQDGLWQKVSAAEKGCDRW